MDAERIEELKRIYKRTDWEALAKAHMAIPEFVAHIEALQARVAELEQALAFASIVTSIAEEHAPGLHSVAEAVAAEQERCARIAEHLGSQHGDKVAVYCSNMIAKCIRAGEQDK